MTIPIGILSAVTPASPPPPLGSYRVIITMDAGPVYTFDPNSPDVHTSVLVEDNFSSDFAGFTMGSTMCNRNDTPVPGALRVYFRQDVTPDPSRMEIILELGKFTTDGSAANLGPFTLQILKDSVPQPIPVPSSSNPAATSTSPHFPGLGWWTRWRWNPTPRAFVRTGSQLLPAALNLLPNFNQAFGNFYGAVANQGAAIAAYSSAYQPGFGNDLNTVGVNESCGLATSFGGTGDRGELGIIPEQAVDYILNGGAAMRTSMLVWAEVDGGIPWHPRDASDNWGPHDFIANGPYGWSSGRNGGAFADPYISIGSTFVTVPSSGVLWDISDLNHTPSLSYAAYILTGDPYYLENLQYKTTWIIGANWYHRQAGFPINFPDYNNLTSSPRFDQSIPIEGGQSRGRAWAVRDLAQCYMATPASVPAWLRPKSYWKALSDLNQQYIDSVRASQAISYPEWTFLGNANGIVDADYGLYYWYEAIGVGLMVNQAGQSNWLPWLTFRGKPNIAESIGTGGWPPEWNHQYGRFNVFFSTDYGIPAAKPASFGDIWTYASGNAMFDANTQYLNFWSTYVGENGCGPLFPQWQPNTVYHCNSWIYEFRGGAPVVPNVGDAVSCVIAGSFAGSPVTVSHTVTSPDVTALIAAAIAAQAGPNPGSHPIIDDLIAQINANSALSTAGINASRTPQNVGSGQSGVGAGQWNTCLGRMFIAFNSDGTNSSGGPVIGPITVSGTYTPNGTPTSCSLYIQANGDGIRNGLSSSAVLYHRFMSYQCSQSGTSGSSGGPTGTALQTPTITDGTCKWTYIPEMKSGAYFAPGSILTPGRAGFGGPYGVYISNQGYITNAMAALASLDRAGVANAATGRNNLVAILNDWVVLNGSAGMQWRWAILP